MHSHATSDKGAVPRVLRADVDIAVDHREVVPEVVQGGLEVVFDLDDTSRGAAILRQISELERQATRKSFRVDHVMENGAIVSRDRYSVIIFAVSVINLLAFTVWQGCVELTYSSDLGGPTTQNQMS